MDNYLQNPRQARLLKKCHPDRQAILRSQIDQLKFCDADCLDDSNRIGDVTSLSRVLEEDFRGT